jgi:DNA-binding XRE family transcriptional regulator
VSTEIEACYRALGARIQMIRETLDMTQECLATKVGYTRTSLVNIEGGRQRVPMHQVEEIAKALATTPRNLLKGIWL